MHVFILGQRQSGRGEGHVVGREHKYTIETIFPANTNKDETHFRLENKQVNETWFHRECFQVLLEWFPASATLQPYFTWGCRSQGNFVWLGDWNLSLYLFHLSFVCTASLLSLPLESGCVILGHLKKRVCIPLEMYWTAANLLKH